MGPKNEIERTQALEGEEILALATMKRRRIRLGTCEREKVAVDRGYREIENQAVRTQARRNIALLVPTKFTQLRRVLVSVQEHPNRTKLSDKRGGFGTETNSSNEP